MKKIFKKNQLIITGLALMIACALLNAWLLVSLPVKRQPYSCTPISG